MTEVAERRAGGGAPARPLWPYLAAVLGFEALLVAGYVAFPAWRFLDLDKEYNLPAWFSGLQLAGIGLASLCAFEAERREAEPAPLRGAWLLLALGFFYLSADEMLAIHEGVLTGALRALLPADSLWQAVLPWQIVFAPGILGAFAVVAVVLHSRLGGHGWSRVTVLGGLAFWVVSFLLEGAAKPVFIPAGLYRLEVGLEETAELLGETCLLVAFGSYALSRARGELPPVRAVRWGWAVGVAGGLVAVAAAGVAALTLSNPAYLHRRSGDKFMEKREYERAFAAYRKAIDVAPGDADAVQRLGRAYLDAKRFAEAADAYRRLITLDPQNPSAHNDLGVALHRAGQIDGAVAAYQAALAVDPAYARAHKNLGVAFEARGDLARAEQEYREAVRHDGTLADAHRYLGDVLRRGGRLAEARVHWQASLDADPRQKAAGELRRRLADPASGADAAGD